MLLTYLGLPCMPVLEYLSSDRDGERSRAPIIINSRIRLSHGNILASAFFHPEYHYACSKLAACSVTLGLAEQSCAMRAS